MEPLILLDSSPSNDPPHADRAMIIAIAARKPGVPPRLAGSVPHPGRFCLESIPSLMAAPLLFCRSRHCTSPAETATNCAYQACCEARTAFRKALADHLRAFAASAI